MKAEQAVASRPIDPAADAQHDAGQGGARNLDRGGGEAVPGDDGVTGRVDGATAGQQGRDGRLAQHPPPTAAPGLGGQDSRPPATLPSNGKVGAHAYPRECGIAVGGVVQPGLTRRLQGRRQARPGDAKERAQ